MLEKLFNEVRGFEIVLMIIAIIFGPVGIFLIKTSTLTIQMYSVLKILNYLVISLIFISFLGGVFTILRALLQPFEGNNNIQRKLFFMGFVFLYSSIILLLLK